MTAAEASDAELARGKLRIAELERQAIERSGDAAKVLRVHLDRYQALVMSIAEVIWRSANTVIRTSGTLPPAATHPSTISARILS